MRRPLSNTRFRRCQRGRSFARWLQSTCSSRNRPKNILEQKETRVHGIQSCLCLTKLTGPFVSKVETKKDLFLQSGPVECTRYGVVQWNLLCFILHYDLKSEIDWSTLYVYLLLTSESHVFKKPMQCIARLSLL